MESPSASARHTVMSEGILCEPCNGASVAAVAELSTNQQLHIQSCGSGMVDDIVQLTDKSRFYNPGTNVIFPAADPRFETRNNMFDNDPSTMWAMKGNGADLNDTFVVFEMESVLVEPSVVLQIGSADNIDADYNVGTVGDIELHIFSEPKQISHDANRTLVNPAVEDCLDSSKNNLRTNCICASSSSTSFLHSMVSADHGTTISDGVPFSLKCSGLAQPAVETPVFGRYIYIGAKSGVLAISKVWITEGNLMRWSSSETDYSIWGILPMFYSSDQAQLLSHGIKVHFEAPMPSSTTHSSPTGWGSGAHTTHTVNPTSVNDVTFSSTARNETWSLPSYAVAISSKTNQQMSIAGSKKFFRDTDFSIAAWAKRIDRGSFIIASQTKQNVDGHSFNFGYTDSGEFMCGFLNFEAMTMRYYETDIGQWVHWTCTYRLSDGLIELYRGGLQVGNNLTGTLTVQDSNEIIFGKSGAFSHASAGEIDLLCVFDRFLENTEVATLPAMGWPELSGAVLWLNFDDNSNLGRDLSPKGNDVTVGSGVTSTTGSFAVTSYTKSVEAGYTGHFKELASGEKPEPVFFEVMISQEGGGPSAISHDHTTTKPILVPVAAESSVDGMAVTRLTDGDSNTFWKSHDDNRLSLDVSGTRMRFDNDILVTLPPDTTLPCDNGILTLYVENTTTRNPATQANVASWSSSSWTRTNADNSTTSMPGPVQCGSVTYASNKQWQDACRKQDVSGNKVGGTVAIPCTHVIEDVDRLVLQLSGSTDRMRATSIAVGAPLSSVGNTKITVAGKYNGTDVSYGVLSKSWTVTLTSPTEWSYTVDGVQAGVTHAVGNTVNIDGFDITIATLGIDGTDGLPHQAGDQWMFGVLADRFKWCERIGKEDMCSATLQNQHATAKYSATAATLHPAAGHAVQAQFYLADGISVNFPQAIGRTLHDSWFTELRSWWGIPSKTGFVGGSDMWHSSVEALSPSRYANVSLVSGVSLYVDLGDAQEVRPEQLDLDYSCWDHASIMTANSSLFIQQPTPPASATITRTNAGCKLHYEAYASNTGVFGGEEVLLFNSTYHDEMYDVTWESKHLTFPETGQNYNFTVGDSLTQAGSTARVSHSTTNRNVSVHILHPGFFDTTQPVKHCHFSKDSNGLYMTRPTITSDGTYTCKGTEETLPAPENVVSFSTTPKLSLACACSASRKGDNCELQATRTDTQGIVYTTSTNDSAVSARNESVWICQDMCCGKGTKVASNPTIHSQGGDAVNVAVLSGAYIHSDTPTFQIQITGTSSSVILYQWCTSCSTGPFYSGSASPGVKQPLGLGINVIFNPTSDKWKLGELWTFTVPTQCTCDEGYYESNAGDCSSKCKHGYEAGHFRCGSACDHGAAYAGVCVCDAYHKGATCSDNCTTSQPHQHCKFGDHRAELVTIVSDTEVICRAAPQQVPSSDGVAVEVSLTKTELYVEGSKVSKEPEYTSSGIKAQVLDSV